MMLPVERVEPAFHAPYIISELVRIWGREGMQHYVYGGVQNMLYCGCELSWVRLDIMISKFEPTRIIHVKIVV